MHKGYLVVYLVHSFIFRVQRRLIYVLPRVSSRGATPYGFEPILVAVQPGDAVYLTANSLLQNTWHKKDAYTFVRTIAVHRVDNPRLTSAYEAYKRSISKGDVENGNEVLVFHGCSESTITLGAPDNILERGFLKKYWNAGKWQRFGPGFYFGQQASKSHEYPLPEYCPTKCSLQDAAVQGCDG